MEYESKQNANGTVHWNGHQVPLVELVDTLRTILNREQLIKRQIGSVADTESTDRVAWLARCKRHQLRIAGIAGQSTGSNNGV